MDKPEDLVALHEKLVSKNGCVSCNVFRLVYNEVGTLTVNVYPEMCSMAMSLLMIALFMWILMHVLKLLTSLREPNLAEFWILLLHTLFKGMLVAVFISTKDRLLYIIDSILMPIASVIIALGAEILDMSWVSSVAKDAVYSSGITAAPGLSQELGLQLENLIFRINAALSVGTVLGLKLFTSGTWANWLIGGICTGIFWMLSIFFPFYLIDGIIRLAFVFCMLPIFLVCWCFRVTSDYLTKGFAMFLGAFLQIMLGCIYVSLAVAVLEGYLKMNSASYLDMVAQDSSEQIFTDASRLSVPFLAFILIAFYLYELSKRINDFTSYLSGAPGTSILGNAVAAVKAGARAVAFAAVAVGAFVTGNTAVARTAAEHMTENAKEAADNAGGS